MDSLSSLIGMAGESSVANKPEIDWVSLERSMGTALPEDYKALVSKYFTVQFGPIWIISPREGVPSASDPLSETLEFREIFEEMSEDDPEGTTVPCQMNGSPLGKHTSTFRFFPETPGLLAWGKDYMGGEYYWYVEGPPHTWTVVAHAARDGWWDEHPVSMSEYLHGIVTRRLSCDVAPREFKDSEIFRELG